LRSLGFACVALVALALASCAGPSPGASKLAAVAAMPKPSLPPWIAAISPAGVTENLAQVRVIFAKPIVPLTALSGSGPRDVLDHVRIAPDLRGRFAVLTPRMIAFVPEQALPIGTRVRITLTAGLRDMDGDRLDRDLAWSFETAPLEFTNVPQSQATGDEATPPPVDLLPKLAVTANAAVDPDSLADHAALVGGGEAVSVTASLETQPTPYPGSGADALFDPSLNSWIYDLKPTRELQRGTTYQIAIDAGVEPLYGNLPTRRSFGGSVRTFGPLAVVPTPSASPDNSVRFLGGDPLVRFTNPLDAGSVAGAVTISPMPAKTKTIASVPDDRPDSIVVDPYALEPDRAYTATIAGSVKDVFGQTLGEDVRVKIRTSGFSPGAWAPSGTNVFPAGAPIALNFYATNLPGDRYQAAYARVTPLQMLGDPAALSLLPPYASWPARTLSGTRRNAQSALSVPIQASLGGAYGALAYGFRTALDAPNSDPANTGIVQLTNLGVFAQWFPSHGMVLVAHLSDGAPVRGADVTVYRVSQDGKVAPQPCAHGTTDARGELDVAGTGIELCAATASANQPPNLGVVVREGTDVATVTVWNYSGVYRFDVNGGWTSGAPLSRGTIFSDRAMYQPGERAQITGIAYYVKGTSVVADANAPYKVTLTDPNNAVASLGTVRTDGYGVFTLPVTFSKRQALGYYTIDAKGANGNDVSGALRVAEFKPPNFKIALTLGATSATAGASVHAAVAASYLFGAPLQGGRAHAYVTRDLATVQPNGWDDFWFGPQWYYPEQTPSFDTDVLQRDIPLDAQGTAALDVAVPRDLPFPMTYRVDLETSDVSNLSVADSKSFLALPAGAVIGLASDAVGKAGSPMPIRVIVTDADGKALSGRSVRLELQKMTYVSATQEVAGGQDAQQAIEYDKVASADVTSAEQPVTAQLTPSDAGAYRVLATFPGGERGTASASSIQVFAFGAGEADWGLSDPNAVAVKLDKKQYAPGETATALVASPYARADVYFAVIRNDAIYRTTLHDVRGAARIGFKVTPEMLPNAAVEAVVVHRGPSKGSDARLAVVGMAGFSVALGDRYLKLSIAPRDATVRPGGKQHVAFALADSRGAPVRGEIVAMAVNDAILQLSGYRLPDLVQTVFAQQPVATIFADNRENVTLKTQTPPLEKGYGYGGGFLAGAASTRVRANFLPLAYYGVLRTDAGGHASADFAMPDDLTTWRVMAVALAASRFGTADATFLSTQPLIANALLPQFARPSDRFDLGVSVANQTGAGGALGLMLSLHGALAFASGDASTLQAKESAASGVQAYRFPVVVGTPAATSIRAQVNLGSNGDALSVPFEVRDRESTDSVIESGATRSQASIPLGLSAGGTLRVTLANTVVSQFVTPSERVMSASLLPLADEAASRLTIAAALRVLRGPYRLQLAFDPAAAIASSEAELLSYQRGDGGFGAYRGASESDPFATAGALEALSFARARGVSGASTTIANTSAFLSRALADPATFKWCARDAFCKAQLRFEALWALATVGPPRTDFLSDVVAQSDGFDSATQIRLARYLLRAPGWQARGAAMAQRLRATLYVTGRYAVANPSQQWSWFGSRSDAQAQMLQLLVEQHAPSEQIDGAVRGLVAQQCKCGWPTAGDTASATTALAAYAATERFEPGVATATVGGRTIGTARFGATASSTTFTVAASSVRGDSLAIAGSGKATVHYLVSYTYPVAPDAPGELAALRVIRTLNDPSVATSGTAAAPLATMDLATALPVSLAAGRVFDVGVRVIVDHPVDGVVIDDPLPAGLEAVDTTFRTSLQAIVPQSNSWAIDTSEIYRDRIVAYAQHLEPGIYDLHYLVRSVTPGTFAWPGARAYLKDAPEQLGRSAAATLTVAR